MVRDHRMQIIRLGGREPASLLGSYVADSAWEPGDVAENTTMTTKLDEITISDLERCADGLESHDWSGYADRVAQLHEALGAVCRMHADSADGNSPDVSEWPRHTLDEARALAEEGIETVDEARTWWADRYAL